MLGPMMPLLLLYYSTSGAAPTDPVPSLTPFGAGADVTTSFIKWLQAEGSGDINTTIRDKLAIQYSSGENEDISTLVTRFEDHNREP